MSNEIAVYTIKVTVRTDNEKAEALTITEIETAVEIAVEDEYDNTKGVEVEVNASASRDDI